MTEELLETITSARWFGSKAREVVGAEIVDRVRLREPEPTLDLALAEVRFQPGTHETYQLLLGARRRGRAHRPRARWRARAPHRRSSATVQSPEGATIEFQPALGARARPRAPVDAPRRRRAVEQLARLRRGADPEGVPPRRGRHQPGARAAPLPDGAGLPARACSGRLVRVLGAAPRRDARDPAGLRPERDRRLELRARLARVRSRRASSRG